MAAFEKRKTDDGLVRYRAKVRIKGYPTQSKTFKRLTDAKRWAQQVESSFYQGGKLVKQKAESHTVAELIDRYIENYLPQKCASTQDSQYRHLQWWRKNIGAYALDNITAPLLVEYRQKIGGEKVRGKKRSASTCNRFMSALSHAFTIAYKEWEWLEQNPITRISKFKEPDGVVRFLDESEQQDLLNSCKESKAQYLYLIVLLGMSTGMRLNEIKSLKWKEVDLKDGFIVVLNTKNKKPRKVPVQGRALLELRKHARVRRIDSLLLFPRRRDSKRPVDIRKSWENARTRAGLTDFRFHDLRHTAASYYAMSGASARDLCDIFGWKTMQMAMRYAHLSDSHTSKLAENMNRKFIDSQAVAAEL